MKKPLSLIACGFLGATSVVHAATPGLLDNLGSGVKVLVSASSVNALFAHGSTSEECNKDLQTKIDSITTH